MDNKLEKFPCLVLKYDWNFKDLLSNLQADNQFILSTKVMHQKNELFRIGLKEPYISTSLNDATLFILTTNLKKLGLKIMTVSFTHIDNTWKHVEKEMDPKTSSKNEKGDDTENIQLFTSKLTTMTNNSTISFTIYFLGITENFRIQQIDGLLSQQLWSSVITGNQDGTDFNLIARDGKSFPVHKWILAARSTVFEVIFFKRKDGERNLATQCATRHP